MRVVHELTETPLARDEGETTPASGGSVT
jgi:hypothetical protein